MSQCKHPKKSFEVSFVSYGMEKGRSLSVFALKPICLKVAASDYDVYIILYKICLSSVFVQGF